MHRPQACRYALLLLLLHINQRNFHYITASFSPLFPVIRKLITFLSINELIVWLIPLRAWLLQCSLDIATLCQMTASTNLRQCVTPYSCTHMVSQPCQTCWMVRPRIFLYLISTKMILLQQLVPRLVHSIGFDCACVTVCLTVCSEIEEVGKLINPSAAALTTSLSLPNEERNLIGQAGLTRRAAPADCSMTSALT